MTTRPTLVQFGDLRLQHFATAPLWAQCHVLDYDEPWYDDTDEETFRPWTGSVPVDPAEAMFLVRAAGTLADGTTVAGFLTSHNGSTPDLSLMQPHIWLPSGGAAGFWMGIFPPKPEGKAAFYREMGRPPSAVFPIQLAAERGLAVGTQAAEILGFYHAPKVSQPPVVEL